MTILGIGTDIIEVERIDRALKRSGPKFLMRLFTLNEQNYCLQYRSPQERFAARFAAKEAIAKALGVGIGAKLDWLDMEITHDHRGKPSVTLSPQAASAFNQPQILLSMSHCKQYATATAIVTSS